MLPKLFVYYLQNASLLDAFCVTMNMMIIHEIIVKENLSLKKFHFLNGNCGKMIMKFSYLISIIIAEKVYHGCGFL